MTDEQREINRRVAMKLGWRIYEIQLDTQGIQWDGHFFQIQKEVPTGAKWYKAHTVESWEAIRESARAGKCGLSGSVPNFCNDPAAADMVRQEIERRGWGWNMRSQRDGTYWAGVFAGEVIADYHRDSSTDSPHMALCLAFLAAVESAEKEGVVTGESRSCVTCGNSLHMNGQAEWVCEEHGHQPQATSK